MKKQPKLYWYAYRLRGFSLGCQPKGFVDYNHAIGKFGAVAYERPLTMYEMENYDLNPLNMEETGK